MTTSSNSQQQVRTRNAPSPTGMLHVGTLYQSLFDYAFAKKYNGQFILRIEDTDRERFVEGAEEAIFAALDWFGIPEDESPRKEGQYGPYRQSERLEIYKKYVLELVENNHAYYCFCTKERLEEVRKEQTAAKQPTMYDRHCASLSEDVVSRNLADGMPHVVRMRIPQNQTITCTDGVRGDISFDSNTIDDQVILKSDGYPTYHLAVVVDDHLMKISHLLRGEEWISSFPKHKILYEYFGWDMPEVFHTPLLRNPDKSKMSKRHGHTSVSWYQEHGILPEALRNFLALMGWSHKGDEEIFTFDEFIKAFELKDLKAVAPIFDLTKLEWMNGEYIRMMSAEELAQRIAAYSEKYLGGKYSLVLIQKTVPLIQTRLKTLKEYDDYCRFFIEAPTEYEKDVSRFSGIAAGSASVLENLEDWKADAIGEALQKYATEKEIKFGEFFMALRLLMSGKKVTPPLNESMEILGKEECVKRLKVNL